MTSAARVRHVLIVPSEEFMPAKDQLAGIFQYHQALALRTAGHRVGALSVSQAYSIPMLVRAASMRVVGKRVHNNLDVFSLHSMWRLALDKIASIRKFVDVTSFDDFPLVRVEGFYYLPPSPSTNHFGWVRAGLVAFDEYCRHFGRPEVIHAHNLDAAGLLAERISRASGIPYVVTEHSTFFRRRLISRSRYPALRRAAESAGAMAAVSPEHCAVVEKELGLRATPVHVPNVVAPVFLRAARSQRAAREGFTFLAIGNLIPVKGHAFLLSAFARAFAAQPDVRLRIGGDGPLEASLQALIEDLGLRERVTMLGRLSAEQVVDEMDACDAFVLPSTIETFGVVVIEALARGKPVVVTQCGGPESIVTEADGMIVPPSDIGALEQALRSMRDDVDRYEPHALRSRAVARYGPATIAEQLGDIYTRVLKGD